MFKFVSLSIKETLEESLTDMGYFISSEEHARKLKMIIELMQKAELIDEPTVASILDDIAFKAEWRDKNLRTVEGWLDDKGFS